MINSIKPTSTKRYKVEVNLYTLREVIIFYTEVKIRLRTKMLTEPQKANCLSEKITFRKVSNKRLHSTAITALTV